MGFLKKFLFAIFGFFFIIFFSTALTWLVLDNTLIVSEPYQTLIDNYANNLFEEIPVDLNNNIKEDITLGLKVYVEQSIDFIKEKRIDINIAGNTTESHLILTSITNNFQEALNKLKESYKLGKLLGLICLILSIILIGIVSIFSRDPKEIISWLSTNLIIATIPIILIAYLTKYILNNFIVNNLPEFGQLINTIISTFTNTLLTYGVIFLIIGIVLFVVKFFIPNK
jgi:hypothetical protein